MRTAARRITSIGAVTAAMIAAIPVSAVTAGASTTAGAERVVTRSWPYEMAREFRSNPLRRCLKATLWGTVSADVVKSWDRFEPILYKNIKFHNPTMRVSLLTRCGGSTASSATKVSMTQRWYDHKCKLSVGVYGGYPWSVGVSVTPECGKRKTANRRTSYSGRHSYYTQNNSGAPIYFSGSSAKQFCISPEPTVTAWVGATSDTWSPSGMTRCFHI